MSEEPSPHLHLLSSENAGWKNLQLIYEKEPAGEMPETFLEHHFIVICQGNFRASFEQAGTWIDQDYAAGDIGIFPANNLLPRTLVDREVGLIELFLDPLILSRNLVDISSSQTLELVPVMNLQDPLIQQMGLALKDELEMGGVDSRLYAESMATALSAHLLRRYSTCRHRIQNYTEGLSQSQLKTVIVYIHEHLDQDLSLTKLAELVQISPYYFARLFKQSTGLASHQYIIRCRIEKAKKLLSQTQLPLIEICYQVGFQNQSHFTRVFRRHTQLTPKTYRKFS